MKKGTFIFLFYLILKQALSSYSEYLNKKFLQLSIMELLLKQWPHILMVTIGYNWVVQRILPCSIVKFRINISIVAAQNRTQKVVRIIERVDQGNSIWTNLQKESKSKKITKCFLHKTQKMWTTNLGIQCPELIISKCSLLRGDVTGGEEVTLVFVEKGEVIYAT